MDRVRLYADISIRRGCGFGVLAIACAMAGVAHDAALAIRGGAIMVMIMWVILLVKGLRAPVRNYRDAELWILLDKRLDDVPRERTQQVIGTALRERYLWHAHVTAGVAAAMWITTFALRLIGV
ncbi:MAG: hypothetical protein FJX67_06640 [Alphaproteobacteria bacterium]|nr:hypothetical protein [Alphaproteobacteria bacterium]